MEQSVRASRRPRPRAVAVPEENVFVVHDLHAVEARSEAPTEVLDRDQRTVRVPEVCRGCRLAANSVQCCDKCQVELVCDQAHHSVQHRRHRIYRRSSLRSTRTRSASSSSWFPVGSVIRWFLATLCVLALLPPRAMAAPTGAPTPSTQPKWVNPCGLNKQDVEQDLEYQGESAASVADIIQRIVTLSKNALDHAVRFRVAYVEDTFQKEYSDHHNLWKSYKYDWLPDIPKELGDKVDDEHLQKQKLEVALKDIYLYLQKYAVGLEQVVLDQKANGGSFKKEFDFEESLLRNVLCEVQVAMAEQGVLQHPDVTPDIMAKSFRDPNMNTGWRNVRDWIILRDYMNGLEYIIQLLEYFSRPQ
ncbi:hypothetical protein KUF71_008504 [Frankliniella fusca]|uniref:Uncharacterized protein n=1 Tax=Frankliniella fusca TaxID=407009 RepID=A0AAE1HDQ5_9NEOP|nr:hypothetical protein KUF71_008504 [Frankliniella fusca]